MNTPTLRSREDTLAQAPMISFRSARVAPEKAVFRPALPLRSSPGLNGTTMTMTFKEQYLHPNWQRKRLEALNRAEFKCESCYDSETTLHVHHKRYVKGRMAWEYPLEELVVLCVDCHDSAHEEKETLSRLLASLSSDGTPWSLTTAASLLAGWCCSFVDEEVYAPLTDDPLAFHIGMLAWELERASGGPKVLDAIIRLTDCIADGKEHFLVRLSAFIQSYEGPGN